ncbi:MAG: YidC/Oxa1 family insertase periplasmic-domain containing protein [Candidatus Eisenbacteria bacterium]|nr:YidC/Oxa1 family insertase periplasmic-domain containing protein [Candidatus Eisenbacteria bacterium]
MDRRTLVAVGLCVLLLIFYQPMLRWMGFGAYLDRGASRHATTDTRGGSSTTGTPAAGPMGGAVSTTPGGTLAANDTTPAAGGATIAGGSASGTAAAGGGSLASNPTSAGSAAGAVLRNAPFQAHGAAIEHSYEIDTPLYHARFSDRGARLVAVEIKRYASALGISQMEHRRGHVKRGEDLAPGDRVVLAGGPLLAVDLGSGDALKSLEGATYAVSESADASGAVRTLTFEARDSSGLEVRQTWRARPQNYALDLEVEIHGVPESMHLSDWSLTLRSWPLVTERNLQSDQRSLKASSMLGDDVHKDQAHSLLRGPKSYDGNVVWAAVQNRYFVSAVAVTDGTARGVVERAEMRPLTSDQLRVLPSGTRNEQDVAINSLRMALPGDTHPVQRFVLYFGPVEFFRLAALKVRLERAVELGWTWVLPFSRALLQLLKWLYGVVPNYGVAIILLATLVRVVLHPLNMTMMKSQRALVKLQPEMERVRAKHKSDPQAMNKAIMALYKENKVNPAGGCLPTLVQMPLFFALYSVLFNAIELRQAPFFGWISDLSAPDLALSAGAFPIRLLPLLMAGSGFLTQALTPTDPSQKPTMYMMNVMMLVFFYNLPSGLVLYWTVMNLLTAAQQWLVLRQDDGPGDAAVEVVSPAAARRARKA